MWQFLDKWTLPQDEELVRLVNAYCIKKEVETTNLRAPDFSPPQEMRIPFDRYLSGYNLRQLQVQPTPPQ